MPRQQRTRRGPPRSAAVPYGRRKDQRTTTSSSDRCCQINVSLPDDALAAIFARLPGPADVVRCAATCTRWMRVVSTSATVLTRSLPSLLPGRFLPQLAVGVIHLDKNGPTARTRTSSAPGSPQPRFLATASSGSTRLRLITTGTSSGQKQKVSIGSLFRGAGNVFDYSRPVASRSGRLVLELHRQRRAAGGVTFCVCSPMTGDVVVLPAVSSSSGKDDDRGKPETITEYGCALLTGNDDRRRPRRGTNFFQLILVYHHRRDGCSTALRCYSSATGRWGTEHRSPVDVSTRELRHIGPAAVLHGAAFWALDHGALGVRPGDDDDDVHEPEVHLLPYDVSFPCAHGRLLGVSPDNRLFFVYFGVVAGDYILIAKISYFDIRGGDIKTGRKDWSTFEEGILMRQMKMTGPDSTLKLRWIGEKSGVVVFTMGGGAGHTGAFALNMRDGTVEKLADGEGHAWGNVLGFEMDWTAYLASIAHHHVKN
ncbi:hypothetical protein QOZ80_1BG0050470 [Eleusine coracana subsp. coracana]|nr:hypothetical protein QOZ80_1BG0050470 [Eleusine coracana subsp. coracana]